jgi:oxygen-dependent protoporphyrinogen oxidase
VADTGLSRKPDRVVIIGGGLTGLTAAHALASRAAGRVDVRVLEARDRLGGAIWTEHRDGFTLEGGADSFITNKPWGVDLCRELGLGDRLIGTDAQHRRSFVVRHGRLLPVPEGFVLMAPNRLLPVLFSPILSLRGKLRLLLDAVLPRRVDDADESLASFVRRRLGREALERLVQPLVGGIYTADPAELSLKATLPQFVAMEREHGGLIRGARRQSRAARAATRGESGARYGMFVAVAGGMGTLPAALAAALPAGAVEPGVAVRRLSRSDGGPWRVERLDGTVLEADAVVVATEAHAAARLLDGLDADLARDLRSIPYASSAIVSIAYPRGQVAHPLDGFGAVVPQVEGRSILAVSFTSVKFPGHAPPGTVLMRVFVGGATQPELFDRDDEAITATVRRELGELLGATGEPLLVEVARHARAMPQYTLGHLDRVALLRERADRHPGLILAGNYLGGVGVPDCIRGGQEAARAALMLLAALNPAAAA